MKTKIVTLTLLIAALIVCGVDAQAQKNEKETKKDKEVIIEKRVVVDDDSEGVEHYEITENVEADDEFMGWGRFHANIPNLTEDQKTQIDKLRMDHQKKVRLMHANLQEKRARLNVLRLADNPDMQQINKTIDEIAVYQADLMKEREAHRMAIRSQLNDEQKAWFESRPRGGRGPRGDGMGPHGRMERCCRFNER